MKSSFHKRILFSILFFGISAFGYCSVPHEESKPNIILIFADDLGWAELPQYGYHKIVAPAGFQIFGDIKMPNIDRLTKEQYENLISHTDIYSNFTFWNLGFWIL